MTDRTAAGGRPWLLAPGPPGAAPRRRPPGSRSRVPDAVLLDRDGTLIEDVPYNADPTLVRVLPGARAALDLLRAHGVALGVVSNQSGVAAGRFGRAEVEAMRHRIESLLGPLGVWAVCPHLAADGCGCRKPAPGLVIAACAALGVAPDRTVVIGDIGSDVAAAHAAGARGVLVPTAATRTEEVAAAPLRAPDLLSAARTLLTGAPLVAGGAP
ncbi:D-glycero-alpha-D-manno-heptose-1,7-bisphosphate 7-phosphatase [Streptomyces millisiae]|uniref:D,D-heptose 1,7-bisphosphate phosphatase n=1 Tax=Streptomyces millisiae TaxID=3075542 RepID=A0ABU2LIK5_9ACTN|nr:HAD-IIIA family hydrolase [Streptomyces sp. DSM 44918]MDT0317402.1 HAD-IIIA family hydrolase [Streptomyces sp. DSM 44918]